MLENEQPLVSVVMPVYNAARFLREAIDSVLCQTYHNIELIMVDDCSTDESMQIMLEYKNADKRIHIISSESNQGVACARNRGIQTAKGEYIALLDSDDVWVSTKLERQVKLIRESKAQIVYCSLDFIDENSKAIKSPFIVTSKTNYNMMLTRCMFTCSTIMTEGQLLKSHPFKSEYYHEDFLLWMELMALPVKTVGDREILMHNRQITSSRSNNKLNAAKHRWKIYREALGMSYLKSGLVFLRYAFWGVVKYCR